MRNFDERMTEIKGRSRMRITRRKKQIVSLCVPFVTCLCIGTALFWRQSPTQSFVQDTTAPVVVTTSAKGSITIICGEERVEHTAPDVVMNICAMIEDLEVIHTDNSTAMIHANGNRVMTAAAKKYTILIEDSQGVMTEYTLSGNVLKDCATELEYALSTYEKAQILGLLDLQSN